jgi:hypothetical protein
MDAVLKCVRQDTIKCVQQVPGPRYRLTFCSLEYKQLFLDQPFHLRGERVIAQELDMPTLLVKVLYAPSEVSNQTIINYGKIVKVDWDMYRDWPNVETGVRMATMSELTEGIPRRLFIGPYPIETRYRGQVPLCGTFFIACKDYDVETDIMIYPYSDHDLVRVLLTVDKASSNVGPGGVS